MQSGRVRYPIVNTIINKALNSVHQNLAKSWIINHKNRDESYAKSQCDKICQRYYELLNKYANDPIVDYVSSEKPLSSPHEWVHINIPNVTNVYVKKTYINTRIQNKGQPIDKSSYTLIPPLDDDKDNYGKVNVELLNSICFQECQQQTKNEFEKIYDKKVNPLLNKLITDELKIDFVVDKFFEYHPWIKELNKNNSLITQFLIQFIKSKLKNSICYQGRIIISWENVTLPENVNDDWNGIFSCDPPLNDEEIIREILNYSFSDIKGLYCDQKSPDFQALNTWLNNGNSIQYPLTHIDVFRFLYNYDFIGMKPLELPESKEPSSPLLDADKEINILPLVCPQFAPFNLKEIEVKPIASYTSLEVILLNVGNDQDPLWIPLHKKKNEWTAYLPDKLDPAFVEISNIIEKISWVKKIEYVDISNNVKLNEYNDQRKKSQWHNIVFGRILPWIKNNSQPLAEYRKNIPLSLLHQQVQLQCLRMFGLMQSDIYTKMRDAYKYAKPISDFSLDEIRLQKSFNKPEQFYEQEQIFNQIDPDFILECFDKGEFKIEDNLKELIVTGEFGQHVLNALYMIYHHPQLSSLTLNGTVFNDSLINEMNDLFHADTNIKVFKIYNGKIPPIPYQCAARNRFLEIFAPKILFQARESFAKRKTLWPDTGSHILSFLQQLELNVDQIKILSALKPQWQKNSYDEAFNESQKTLWMFAQITEMGQKGLHELFTNLIDRYKNRNPNEVNSAPRLNCTFDLSGSMIDKPDTYTNYLTQYIQEYDKKCQFNVPLFNSLSLILPEQLDNDFLLAFKDLMTLINKRKKLHSLEMGEIKLYNLNPENAIDLFKVLNSIDDIQVQINIPSWNQEIYREGEERKAFYRKLQNTILANQQKNHDKKLKEQELLLQNYAIDNTKSTLEVSHHLAQKEQYWPDKIKYYSLGSQAPSIQYQVESQQELGQEVAQGYEEQLQVQQEEEREEQKEYAIGTFKDNIDDLITRENIQERCIKDWEEIPRETKNNAGIKENDLRSLFSLWVGSDRNADYVIESIAPAAVRKMMQHASQFRLGIPSSLLNSNKAKDNLPAGFYLETIYNKNGNKLILRFDENREKQELLEQLDPKKRNPFKMVLSSPASATEFRGDFRQFDNFLYDLDTSSRCSQTLWQFLATEDLDPVRIKNLKDYAKEFKIIDDTKHASIISVITQQQDLKRQKASDVIGPADYAKCISYLKDWSYESELSKIGNVLFDRQNPFVLTESNLKAFGQLFNHYSFDLIVAKNQKFKYAGQQWLYLAEQIWIHFPEYFGIWKERFLNVSKNWTELLEKEEVTTITQSILALKDKPYLKAIWWKIVDKHGEAIGPISMRYADLWHAFAKVLNCIKNKKLNINETAFFKFLNITPNFNAQVFLDRLNHVLENTATLEAQQSILNNLDRIDWRHNGFFYASQYEHFPYWTKDLKLNEFISTTNREVNEYKTEWNSDAEIINPLTQALRFASLNMRLDKDEFKDLKKLLISIIHNNKITKDAVFYAKLRLLMACFSLGVDRIKSINQHNVLDFFNQPISLSALKWINECLYLNQIPLEPHTFTIKFEHIPTLCEHIDDLPNEYKKELSHTSYNNDRLSFLNICGRAGQIKIDGMDGKLYSIIFDRVKQLGTKQALKDLLISDCPWLLLNLDEEKAEVLYKLNQDHEQLNLFKKQLHSIDFSNTPFDVLPTYEEMAGYFKRITHSDVKIATQERRAIINALIKNGCVIGIQDFAFRKLNLKEINDAKQFLDANLKPHFKKQNFQLCKILLERLAIQSEDSDLKTLKNLLKIFIQIDNKAHYDELGRVIGSLLAKSSKSTYYSAQQLFKWLETLISEDYHQTLYPIDILNEIVRSPSTLLNQDLNQLEATPPALKPGENTDICDWIKNNVVNSEMSFDCQRLLVKMCMEREEYSKLKDITLEIVFNEIENINPNTPWMTKFYEFIKQIKSIDDPTDALKLLESFKISLENCKNNLDKRLLYQQSLNNLFDSIIEKKLEPDILNNILHNLNENIFHKNIYISIILSNIKITKKKNNKFENMDIDWNDPNDIQEVKKLIATLNNLDNKNSTSVQSITDHLKYEPFPSVQILNKLLTSDSYKSISDCFERFEKEEQTVDHDGNPKYKYSLDKEDRNNLDRILKGIKIKGKRYLDDIEQKQLVTLLYYCNQFSETHRLHDLSTNELQNKLFDSLDELKISHSSYASARVLACMRMILLRKTGKWANHTQMLDLLYAALHSDDNIIHEMRTGEGKSIVSMMRTAYLALNGFVVDVFTAKDSLSERDYKEFACVYDGMNISHGRITAKSDAKEYKTKSNFDPTIGAVNFSTINDSNLFFSGHVWRNEKLEIPKKEKRVAWVDEIDDAKDEKTQANFSAALDGVNLIFNYDEWVYRITYDYYKQLIKNKELDLNDTKISTLHLKKLSDLILKNQGIAPQESRFIKDYLYPATVNDDGSYNKFAVKNRNCQLKRLIRAAQTAYRLGKDEDFCIYERILASRASVMIKRQVKEGSTYSELVHQFLHVRLNKEAAKKGKTPNFFVEPDTFIALSLTPEYILKNNYHKIEGATGTAGDRVDIEEFKRKYRINKVIKWPSHLEPNTRFLPPEYAIDEDDQVKKIVLQILNNPSSMPILITCENDKAVKRLYEKILNALKKEKPNEIFNFIKDTNDSGISENQILPFTELKGTITISSRMGRGTDIKPEGDDGLKVIRTYPAPPAIEKQERGRQSRGGRGIARGTAIDIINYGPIEQQYNHYKNIDRFNKLYIAEEDHLQAKANKHKKNHSTKWDWVADPKRKEIYLRTRCVTKFNERIKKENEKYKHLKNELMATLSGEIINVLNQINQDTERDLIKKDWIKCRQQIDTAWDARLSGESKDSDQVYNKFYEQAYSYWKFYCKLQPKMNLQVIENCKLNFTPSEDTVIDELIIQPNYNERNMPEVIAFYQAWIASAKNHTNQFDQSMFDLIYGKNPQGMETFYDKLLITSSKIKPSLVKILFTELTNIVKENPNIHYIPYHTLIALISNIQQGSELEMLHGLKAFNIFLNKILKSKPNNSAAISKIDVFLTLTMDMTYQQKPEDSSIVFIENFIDIVHATFLNDKVINRLQKLFSQASVTQLLSGHINKDELYKIIDWVNNANTNYEKQLSFCQKYLETYQQYISKSPYILMPILNLTLHPSRFDTYYLPPPDCVEKFSSDIQQKFWNFISQSPNVYEKSCKEFIDILNLMNPLLAQHFFKVAENYTTFSLEKMNELARFYSQWSESEKNHLSSFFLLATNIASFTPEEQKIINPYWLKIINESDISQAIKLCNDLNKKLDILKTINNKAKIAPILHGWWTNKLDISVATESAEMLNKIHSFKNVLPSISQSMEEYYIDYMHNPLIRSLYIDFFTIISPYINLELNENMVLALLPMYLPNENGKSIIDNKALEDSLYVLMIIARYPTILSDLFYDFKTQINNVERRMQFIDFLKLMNQYYSTLNEKTWILLAKQHLTNDMNIPQLEQEIDLLKNTIAQSPVHPEITRNIAHCYFSGDTRNIDTLDETLKTAIKVDQLKKNENYSEYFSYRNSANKKDREKIMQFLTHDLLDINHLKEVDGYGNFINHCFDEYKNLAKKLPDPHDKVRSGFKHVKLFQCYQELFRFSQEMERVATSPFVDPHHPLNEKKMDANYTEYFTSQRKNYSGFWITVTSNKLRKKDAKDLFGQLDTLNKQNLTRDTFYEEALKTIWSTQQNILTGDYETNKTNFFKQNTSGFSRLNDICASMFLKLSRDYLVNSDKSDNKPTAFINAMLQMQLEFQINLLNDYLTNSRLSKKLATPLKKLIQDNLNNKNAWLPESPQLTFLYNKLWEHKEKIPPYLTYLVQNILNLTSVSESVNVKGKLYDQRLVNEALYNQEIKKSR